MKPAGPIIKLSAPATREYWEIAVLYEDAHLLALNKPARLLTSPDRYDAERPNLMRLLHRDIERGAPWAATRGLTYLSNAHRLDFETTGVILLAKDKPTLISLASMFGSEKPVKTYVALVTGAPPEDEFVVDVKLAPDERNPGLMRWTRDGKKSLTKFRVRERFAGATLLECRPFTGRTHQIRVHLKSVGFPIFGDDQYAEGRRLYLSQLKSGYRLKFGQEERSLTPTLALHAWKLELPPPAGGDPIEIVAPWPKDLEVALKFLRRHAAAPV